MTGAVYTQSAFGWLELKPLPGRNMIQISSHAMALKAVTDADFTLSIRRQNQGNSSSSSQSGRFNLEPKEPRVLATTLINVDAGDELIIELKILDHGKEMSRATISSKRVGDGPTP
jgi:hypothetical protein